jgi:hypothetical protein
MSYKLPERFRDKVSGFPESSYGVSLVTLVLDDGTKMRHVRIAWGEEIIDDKEMTFRQLELSRIVDVESES